MIEPSAIALEHPESAARVQRKALRRFVSMMASHTSSGSPERVAGRPPLIRSRPPLLTDISIWPQTSSAPSTRCSTDYSSRTSAATATDAPCATSPSAIRTRVLYFPLLPPLTGRLRPHLCLRSSEQCSKPNRATLIVPRSRAGGAGRFLRTAGEWTGLAAFTVRFGIRYANAAT